MPFSKILKGKGRGKYRSHPPGGGKGKIYTKKQIRLYYATKGFTKKPRSKR